MRHILLTKGLLQAHSVKVYDARVAHRLKDPYLVQKIGGAVAVVDSGDGCAFADDLDGNPLCKSGTLKPSLTSLRKVI